jgi:hypothetical protein
MEDQRSPDFDELKRILAARHAEFEEAYKRLTEKLAKLKETVRKPLPAREPPPRRKAWEPSAATKEADAKLKAMLEYIRNLPRRDATGDSTAN